LARTLDWVTRPCCCCCCFCCCAFIFD
jgi:hypothetical protein